MKYVILFALFAACSHPPSNEMESMTRDILKEKQGVEIQVIPLPKKCPLKK